MAVDDSLALHGQGWLALVQQQCREGTGQSSTTLSASLSGHCLFFPSLTQPDRKGDSAGEGLHRAPNEGSDS
jgi:hypothetical protein